MRSVEWSGPLEVALESLRSGRLAQLGERLGLDLADALSRDLEMVADWALRMAKEKGMLPG